MQACGDAHVSNFGKFATPERNLVFDINDFDETLPGPWEWDVKRLSASLQIVAERAWLLAGEVRRGGHDGGTRVPRAHGETSRPCAPSTSGTTGSRCVTCHRALPGAAPGRACDATSDGRSARTTCGPSPGTPATVDGHLRLVDDPPLITHLERHGLRPGRRGVADRELPRAASPTNDATCSTASRTVDVARKVVGVGSVGTRCWIGLLEGPSHRVGDRIVLQVKEAQPSVLEPYVGCLDVRSSRSARRGRSAPHAGRERHLPRMGSRRSIRPPVLRAPAVGCEGPERPDGHGREQPRLLRRAVRLGARPGPRPHRRSRADLGIPRAHRTCSIGPSPTSPSTTPWSTHTTTRCSSMPSRTEACRP